MSMDQCFSEHKQIMCHFCMATVTASIVNDQDNTGTTNALLNNDSTIEMSNLKLNQTSSSAPSTSNATTIEAEANRGDENLNESASHSSSSPGDESPVLTSCDCSASHQTKDDQPNEKLGEALETEAMMRLSKATKTLLSDLQQATLDWIDELLTLRDKIQRDFHP